MNYFRNTVVTQVDVLICGGAAILLLLIFGGFFMMIRGQEKALSSIDSEIAALQSQISLAKQVAAQRDSLEERIVRIEQQISDFEGRLPSRREIPRLLDSFQAVASSSGIQYQRIVAEAPQSQGLYEKLPFRINARGRYPQFGEFLKNLEFSERFIKVEDITMSQEAEGVSDAVFLISTYTFIEEGA